MNIDQIRYGGCYQLEIRGYKDNHLRLESMQLVEHLGDAYEYLSNFFRQEIYTSRCDSYDVRIGIAEIAKAED